jgi:hypothetical protein
MNTTQSYLEHANLTVTDLDATLAFIQLALPDFVKRGEGKYNGRKWVHIGTQESYLAINEESDHRPVQGRPLNHLGIVVQDVDAVVDRLVGAGYKRSSQRYEHPYRVREYFEDAQGTEYEFIQYLSEEPAKRNSYEN